jgi:hypothetical protein
MSTAAQGAKARGPVEGTPAEHESANGRGSLAGQSDPIIPTMTAVRRLRGVRYAAAIFLGAFLLFQVQPLLGQAILPWFGGASSVWTACLLVFQALLVLGYAYAHWLSRWTARRQVLLHAVILLISLAFLPVLPAEAWRPEGGEDPVLRIVLLLVATVGVPYVLLAATGPLLQSWLTRETSGASPYRYYALSNAASLLGLLTYPFLLQPRSELTEQAGFWSWGYGAFALAVIACGIGFAARRGTAEPAAAMRDETGSGGPGAAAGGTNEVPETVSADPAGGLGLEPDAEPSKKVRALWALLPAAASALLLGITNTLTSEVAAVPFLWVLPLALYLITFIIAFEHPGWAPRRVLVPLLIAVLVWNSLLIHLVLRFHWWHHVVGNAATVFVAGLLCHTEVARLRPHPRHLTAFYLTLSVGGALGGFLVAVGAPLVFPGYWEVPLTLFAIVLLFLYVIARASSAPVRLGPRARIWTTIGVGAAGPLLMAGPMARTWESDLQKRSFYGVVDVATADAGTPQARRIFLHGSTVHGTQFLDPVRSHAATTYFGKGSGVDVALSFRRAGGRRSGGSDRERVAVGDPAGGAVRDPEGSAPVPLSIGVVGLGAGTIAAWGEPGDVMRFYELDPLVEEVARDRFSYLSDSRARVDVVIGDGRIALERDLAAGQAGFDVLVLDAFSGGSIPMHLLTREAFAAYRLALAPGGLLAVHVSNKHLDLTRVVAGAAMANGMLAFTCSQGQDRKAGIEENVWVLAGETLDPATLPDTSATADLADAARGAVPVVWTDRFSSLLPVLKR